MALTKITAAIIEDGAITASALSDNSIGITQLNVSDGTSGQFLKTDGSGNLSFASVPAGYTDSDVESYLSGGTGVTFSSGVISIGQDVGTSSTPTFGNITTTGYIAGPATFTIDPAAVGDNTGTVVIAGNLQVDGTTTTINSTTMEVDDLNITLASGAANAAAANGAGITVDGASATITYDGTNDAWSFNKNVGIGTTSPERALHIVGGLHLENDYKISWDQANGDLRNAIYVDSGDDMIIGDPNFDDIYFSTGGKTKTVVIKQTTGNVGIGTTSPAAGLQVSKGLTNAGGPPAGASTAAACFGNDGSDDNYGLVLGADGNGLGYISAQRTDGTATTYPLSIQPNGGNVGIGTTSPNNYANLSTLTIDGTNGSVLDFESGGTLTGEIFSSSASLAISFKDDSDCVFYGNITERMRIASDGTTTIGQAITPTYGNNSGYPLHIQAAAGAQTYLSISVPGAASGNTGLVIGHDATGTRIINREDDPIIFQRASGETMRIHGNGNVGIGTTTPNQLLTVNLPARNDTETNSLGAAVVAGPISGPPSHDFTNSNCIFRVQGNNATNNIQFGVGNGTYGYNPWIQASYDNSSTVHTDHNAKHLLIQPIGGSVAIGKETYASAKLEVVGSIYSNNEGGSSYSSYGTGAALRSINLSINQSATHYIEIGGNLPGYNAGSYNCLKTDLSELHFAAGGVYTGYISYNGGFTDVSDEREKENIVTITNATAKLKQLRGVYHTWKDTASRGTDTHIGLIAQEVEAVVPEVVTTSNPISLNTPESDTDGLKGVAYAKLVPLLIETIKELEARITTLEG